MGQRIKTLKELRGYGLGERNPETLPGSHPKAESEDANQIATQRMRRRARWAWSIDSVGAKY
jgi:hypothetical protein